VEYDVYYCDIKWDVLSIGLREDNTIKLIHLL